MGYPINYYLSRFVDFVLPPRCVNCRANGSLFCTECQTSLQFLEPPVCKCCGEPVKNTEFCLRCQNQALQLSQLRATFLFTGSIPKVIHQFKYNNAFGLARPLSQLMIQGWQSWTRPIDVIMPIPLHPQRLRERGYNQSLLLARPFANDLKILLAEESLIRVRQTKAQARLSAQERQQNVNGAFQVQHDVRGLKILLIDDVCTTGATLDAAASALLDKGAKEVSAYCLARASNRGMKQT